MIIVLTGATGTGKSDLAIALAKKLNGEIINADAFQVYEKLSISTAAPSEEQKREVPHHLYSFVPLTEGYDIHRYQEDARKTLQNLKNLGKTPIFVGGSGLYIRAALYDYDLSLDTSNVDMSKYDSWTNEELHKELEKLDPAEAEKIPYQNRQRMLRSIMICLASGTSKTELLSKQNHEPIEKTLFFVLKKDREDLYPALDKRVNKMVEMGLENEVVPLLKEYGNGAAQHFQRENAISVYLWLRFPDKYYIYKYGEVKKAAEELQTVIENIKLNTRHYVKRQDTFFRHQFPAIEVSSLEDILKVIENERDN